MKTRLSSRGQVVIPQRAREHLGLIEGTELEVEIKGDRLVLKKAKRGTRSWREWEGKFKGMNLTRNLLEEHRAEIERDEKALR